MRAARVRALPLKIYDFQLVLFLRRVFYRLAPHLASTDLCEDMLHVLEDWNVKKRHHNFMVTICWAKHPVIIRIRLGVPLMSMAHV